MAISTKEYMRIYRVKNREKIRKLNKKWRINNLERRKELNRQERIRLKKSVVEHYSNGRMECINCNFDDLRALQIDHIDNNGAEERRKLFGSRLCAGTTFYRWLRKNDYPIGYQVLCANCNTIKHQENIINEKHNSSI